MSDMSNFRQGNMAAMRMSGVTGCVELWGARRPAMARPAPSDEGPGVLRRGVGWAGALLGSMLKRVVAWTTQGEFGIRIARGG